MLLQRQNYSSSFPFICLKYNKLQKECITLTKQLFLKLIKGVSVGNDSEICNTYQCQNCDLSFLEVYSYEMYPEDNNTKRNLIIRKSLYMSKTFKAKSTLLINNN